MDRHLKLWEGAALTALCATLLAACWAQGEQTALGEAVIRLHVVAVSDAPEEQALKLRVRDAVLDYLDPILTGAQAQTQARDLLFDSLNGIAAAASGAAEGRQVTVTFGPANYPARSFEGGTLPAGRYESLRVILGEGEGHNWWGLLFPQLCLPAAQGTAETEQLLETLSRDGLLLVPEQEGYELRFQVLEWWGELRERFARKESDCTATKEGIY